MGDSRLAFVAVLNRAIDRLTLQVDAIDEAVASGAFRGRSATATLAPAHFARRMLRNRRRREAAFDTSLFADPAWDMLLDLFVAWEEGALVSVSSLCIASSIPPTTALRWISSMEKAGHFVRSRDPNDDRRMHLSLSPSAHQRMDGLLNAMAEAWDIKLSRPGVVGLADDAGASAVFQ